jgi:hypothetical protein
MPLPHEDPNGTAAASPPHGDAPIPAARAAWTEATRLDNRWSADLANLPPIPVAQRP